MPTDDSSNMPPNQTTDGDSISTATTTKSSFVTPADTPEINTIENTQAVDVPPTSSESLDFSTTPQVSDTGDASNQGGKKAIATILGVVLLVAGVAAGVLLVNRNSEVRIKAWDCVNYVFEMSEDGVVSVRNGSTRNEPLQKAQVKINGEIVATLDVPALSAGDAATLGTVPVPSGGFSWEVFGTKDCENTGTFGEQSPTPSTSQARAQCGEVVAYDSNWNPLSNAQLSQLEEGDVVRFTVSGSATSGVFERARFIINGDLRPEVTDKRPGSDDFYDEYTIPSSTIDFTIEAEIMHSELGWM